MHTANPAASHPPAITHQSMHVGQSRAGFLLYTSRLSHLPRVKLNSYLANPPEAALSWHARSSNGPLSPIHLLASQSLHPACSILSSSPVPFPPRPPPCWPRWWPWTPNGSPHSPLPCGLCPSSMQSSPFRVPLRWPHSSVTKFPSFSHTWVRIPSPFDSFPGPP